MSSQKRSLPWFGVFSSSLIGNYVFSSTTAPLENITRFATSSASKTHSIFNSSRTMKTEYHEQKLTGIRPSGVIRADDGGFETYTRLVVRTNPLNNTEVVSNKAKTVVGRSSRISLPVNSTQLMTFSNSSISLVSVHLQSSSSMEEMENTTNSSVESTDSGKYSLWIELKLKMANISNGNEFHLPFFGAFEIGEMSQPKYKQKSIWLSPPSPICTLHKQHFPYFIDAIYWAL